MPVPVVTLLQLLAFATLASAAPTPLADYPTDGENDLSAGGGGKCRYNYDTHDGMPVVSSATCTISNDDLDKGCDTDETTRDYARKLGGHDGVDDDDAGHILAHRLGGSGSEPTNIFPQAPHDNRGPWREMEAAVYDCVNDNDGVTAILSWTFHYDGSDHTRPTSMDYETRYDGVGLEAAILGRDHPDECAPQRQSFDNQ